MEAFFYPETVNLCTILPDKTIVAIDHIVNPDNFPGIIVSFTLILNNENLRTGRCLIYLGIYNPATDTFEFLVHKGLVRKGVLYACGMQTIRMFWDKEVPQLDFMHHYLNLTTSDITYTLSSISHELNQDALEEILTFFDADFAYSHEDNLSHNGLTLESNLVL